MILIHYNKDCSTDIFLRNSKQIFKLALLVLKNDARCWCISMQYTDQEIHHMMDSPNDEPLTFA